MLFLGIDTATRVGSVGLVRAAFDAAGGRSAEPGRISEGCALLSEVSRDTGLGHGSELLPMIDECLTDAGVALDAVGCIAVSLGPGSFTGLRVALATAKGLSVGGGPALVGVPTLTALAECFLSSCEAGRERGVGAETVLAPCLDARKGEVYGAIFRVREPLWEDPSPRLARTADDAAVPPATFGAMLASAGPESRVVLLGDGAVRYAHEVTSSLGDRVRVLGLDERPPSGAAVARAGAGLYAARGADDLAQLVPRYARASEAEIMRERRRTSDGTRAPS